MKRVFILGFLFILILSCEVYPQLLKDLEQATMNVAREAGAAVVSISATIRKKEGETHFRGSPFKNFGNEFFRGFFDEFVGELPEKEYIRIGLGSGIIIDKKGYVLTNEHVISGAGEIKVKLSDGREFDAVFRGKDKKSDLAIIKIEAKNLPVAKLGDSDELRIGQWSLAIGNPFGFAIANPEPTVTLGVISALHRSLPAFGQRARVYDDLIQTDAAINPGNSGGPLVNLEGEIIGVNTAIITTGSVYQEVGFAIPINKVKKILKKLMRGEEILYGWVGVSIQDLNDDLRSYFGIRERKGVIVVKVFKDSPGDRAKIKEGDLILAFGGEPIKASRDLVKMVTLTQAGEKIPLVIMRSGKKKTLKIKVGKRPEDTSKQKDRVKDSIFRGMTVENITPDLRKKFGVKEKQGVVIVSINDASPAEKSGVAVGEVILNVGGSRVENKNDFKYLTAGIKGKCLIKTDKGYFVLKEE